MADPLANSRRGLWPVWLAALTLFAATAAVVVWQNSRLGVVWDLSYVLDSSYRISLGDLPYRDFPFPHAPLTFLIQAALIKLAGLGPEHRPISELMTRDPVVLRQDDTIAVAINKMAVGGFRHVPIVDGHRPVAVVSARDVFRHISTRLG